MRDSWRKSLALQRDARHVPGEEGHYPDGVLIEGADAQPGIPPSVRPALPGAHRAVPRLVDGVAGLAVRDDPQAPTAAHLDHSVLLGTIAGHPRSGVGNFATHPAARTEPRAARARDDAREWVRIVQYVEDVARPMLLGPGTHLLLGVRRRTAFADQEE